MRAIWKGAITFGLVNVPIKLYSATESHDVQLHQVHDADGGRIRYQRRCEICGKVVEYENIDKAYDDGQQTVVLTSEDIESLPVERSREIDVQEFVPSEQVDPIMFGKTYYLSPDSKSTKSYVLLRRTLEETDRTAIVTFTLRDKTRLGALRVRGDVLVLQSLLWEDEVREASFPALDEKVSISSKELEMSSALVSSFESDFDPERFTDDYQVQLRQLIEAKLEQGEALDTETTFGEGEEEEGGQVLDLMEALRRSVEQSRKKGDKAEAADEDEAPAKTGTDDASAQADEDAEEQKKPARKSAGSSTRSKKSTGSASKASSSKTSETKTSGSKAAESKASESKSSGAKTAPARKKAPAKKKTATKKSA
ncbi:non-homologous end joining protein Ku [Georgenia subflava]|uniref:Non-homologous end joining protein Ku n=1 Tax=Georgenia subflava TaxID=1622177 RepID=A0A6N7EJ33_9MICO|nr:Ku protein [Georgenia subflava]MPV36196.1 Ku protein [Georgenia subflava]